MYTNFVLLLATGIIDAGGRNSAITLVSRSGLIRRPAVVGAMLFMHHWYWYPAVHFLSLALSPTGVIAVNERFKMPVFRLRRYFIYVSYFHFISFYVYVFILFHFMFMFSFIYV